MSTVLVIYAHPQSDKESSTKALYNHFIDSYKSSHPDDKIIEHNVSEYMPFPLNKIAISIYNKSMARQPLNADEERFKDSRQKWIDEFVNADKYVFVNPMYNLFIPAEMKSYIDIVMQVPDTFHYTSEGIPEGNLHNKKAIHLQATGGNYHGSNGAPDASSLDLGHQYIGTILHIMGIDDYQGVFAEGMDHDPKNAEKILNAAFERAEQAAKEF
ncbi:FMN-dependent NADH-azoreductase [Companilactobacillus sp. HBUAS56275]|jgi:Acyl carrier protein phosphodiesterase|uniref:FMN dependent NADH:quinone oxidoreductase n=1 Tax=Candidatus Companilactobacillus pullicola TaxID=2838523 RepID=A0A9D1ZQK0_9LACO|nr:NAD(P)H-dependent oxidoreductase [Candidatus Companilactobacillus pullicola]